MNMALFHFLRPEWLVAMIPFALLCLWLWQQGGQQSGWRKVVSAELLPYLLIDSDRQRRRWPILIIALAGSLAIIAMAGPTWERLPKPVFRDDAALVIVLDLSRSMNAQDIKPSRIQRAHFKIADIIKARTEGQTALIVYAADAFTVTPLTDDGQTIISQLAALTPSLMPAQGNRADLALTQAIKLLRQASQTSGDILLITDEVPAASSIDAAQQVAAQGYRLSILGIGTTEGAPIPERGGMLKDRQGNIIIARLNSGYLQDVAAAGGGNYIRITADDNDLKQLDVTQISRLDEASVQSDDMTAEVWKEFGPWLLLPILPLAALVFRRGILILALVFLIPLPQPANAAGWRNLWQTSDQQAQQLMQQDKPAEAAKQFSDPAWRASAQYRSNNYEDALEDYQSIEGSEARYNEGNTLAKLGSLEDALKTYDKTLKLDPDHEDAKYNRKLVEEALKKQQQQQADQNQSPDQSQEQSQDQSDQDSSSDKSQQEREQGENSLSDSSQAQSGESQQEQDQKDQNQSPRDQQAAEQPSEEPDKESDNTEQNQQAGETSESDQQKQADPEEQQPAQAEALDDEERLAREQWLKRIPDDPAGLLRRKFKYQYKQRARQNSGEKTW